MRDFALFYINGGRHTVTGPDLFLSLADFLRTRLGLVGTKVVCSEGDCGACSVLIGRPDAQALRYQVADSCIQFLFQLDGAHVVSVEGLTRNGELNPVQQAMVECHGSQCGFCTPGFVVGMTGLFEDHDTVDETVLRRGLTGNLCRCTGYVPIIDAGLSAQCGAWQRMHELYSPAEMLDDFSRHAGVPIRAAIDEGDANRLLFSPATVTEAVAFLAKHPDATIVAGATDLGVRFNKGWMVPNVVLDLNRVRELEGVELRDGTIIAGARATWTEIEQITENILPEFHRILTVFGAPQIRNVGTIGGNIINASPIADSLPLLLVVEAELELRVCPKKGSDPFFGQTLTGGDGVRTVNVNDFYRGYKRTDLQPGELLTKVRIPVPTSGQLLRLYKVSKRRDLDIASVTAAILIELSDETIRSAAIAYGAVGPTVVRLRQTEEFLIDRPFCEHTMRDAGDIAVEEISPISDVRGTSGFRYQLARNILVKFFHDVSADDVLRTVLA